VRGLPTISVCLLALSLACNKGPAGRQAYEGSPLRANLDADCDPATHEDGEGQACVEIDVFAEGEGPRAEPGQALKLHYMVLLPDGSEVDSSHGRKPLSFRLHDSSELIEGVHIGVEGMRVGERRRFVVPPKLGYRGRKMPGIPPDADLTFLAELVELESSL
jgi:FKBP-type peptidyl-prolyl cis-trans isomerase